MYLIDTYVDKSPIQGLGVFAGDDIAQGTIIWREQKGFDLVLTVDQVAALPPRAMEFMETYAYYFAGRFHLNVDNGKFTNHDDHPNSRMNAEGEFFACRFIRKGDEITADYDEFSNEWPALPDVV